MTKEATISLGSEALDKKSKLLATILKTGSAIYGQNDTSTWSLLPKKILVVSFVFDESESYKMLVISKSGEVVNREPLEVKKAEKLKNIYRHYSIRDGKVCK